MRKLLGWSIALAVMSVALPALAQSRATAGDLNGAVLDQSGSVVPGASVTVSSAETGLVRSVSSEADGRFAFPALPVGVYTVRASFAGFAPRVLQNIVLTLGSSVDVVLSLDIAGTQEQITVVGELPIFDLRKHGVATSVSRQQIESLPINVRNFISYSLISPAVSTDRTPQQGASRTSGLTFGGQRARSNNVTVDGLDNNDETIGSVRATFSQEAVQEFQLLTAGYPAEFGKAGGGVVNIVTKSGTNQSAGNAFGFFRDEALNAKGHFERFNSAGDRIDRQKGPYRQTQFGGTFGGPLKRDKSFFFGSFERLNIRASNFVTINDEVPIRHPVLPGVALGTPAGILRNAGFPVETGNVPFSIKATQLLAKVDHNFGSSHRLSLRVNAADERNENIEPFGGQVARSRAAALESQDQMLAFSHTAVGPAKMVNELRFQIANRDQMVVSLDPLCQGPCDADDEGGPTLEVIGVASVGRQRFTPSDRDNTRYQLLDSFSYGVGQHLLKAGFDYSHINGRDLSLPLHFGGRYIFFQEVQLPLVAGASPVSVSSIQALALGLPTVYVQGYGNPNSPYDSGDLSLFAQDDWRLHQRLTLKLGVRYQRQFWPKVSYNVTGYPRTYEFPRDNNNLAPRLGVAWDPRGDRKTFIHAASGIFFDNVITSVGALADVIDGQTGVRTAVLPAPRSFVAWNTPGRRLAESAAAGFSGGQYPSLQIAIDPGLKTSYSHHASTGFSRELPGRVSASADFVAIRGFKQLGTIDYNPVDADLGFIAGAGFVRRPADIGGIPGTSASVLQYTSFGETRYRGLTLSANKRLGDGYQFLASYTLAKAEDNSTDFQSAFIPQNNGRGRNPQDLEGLPIGFSPDDEKGPSLQDQRHRLVVSGLYFAPAGIYVSAIATFESGRSYNILAGVDLNFDGNGGAFPPDRARRDPAIESTSVGRNSGTLPRQMTVDLRVAKEFALGGGMSLEWLLEMFNVLNRSNFTEVQNIFGPGSYPTQPIPTFGQFTQAGPPRQVQLAVKLKF